MHKDINGVNQIAITNETVKIQDIDGETKSDSECRFRHTAAERRNILKGQRRKPYIKLDESKKVDNFKVKASASARKWTGPTHLIYVGRLSKASTCDSLREQLLDIGVTNVDIADILHLNCRNRDESLFCVSIHGDHPNQILLDPVNWPYGIRIRPYHSGRSNHPRRYAKHTLQQEFDKILVQCDHQILPEFLRRSRFSKIWQWDPRNNAL